MKCDASRGRLYDALRQIVAHWGELEPHWNDAVRRDFEEKIWEPLNALTEDTLRALDRLTQVFAQVRKECEGEMLPREYS